MSQRPQGLYCGSGGEQDTRGRAEKGGHRGPSPWDARIRLLPPKRTKFRIFAVDKLDGMAPEPPGVEPPFRAEGALSKYCPF